MTFTFRPAKRENVPLLIGVAGGTGSGKTMSALRLARGIAGSDPMYVIDTENGRAKHYADDFAFLYGELQAPFRPSRYAEAIEAAEKAGAKVIVVDSMSHEWAGDGGMLDFQEEEMRGEESRRLTAWIKPKMEHKRFVTRLLQVNAHVILCFRAEPKVEMRRGDDGRWEIVPKPSLVGLNGWLPISEKNLPYELTASFLLMPDAPGIPKPIKLQEQHRPLVPLDQPLSEQTGAALAAWAAGGESAPQNSAEEKTGAAGSEGETGALTPSGSSGSTAAPPPPSDVITGPQRKRLYSIASSRKIPKDEVLRIMRDVAGVDSSTLIPKSLYDAVTAQLEAWEPQQSLTGAA